MGPARDERHGRPERNARRRMVEQQRLHRVGQRDQHRGRHDPRHALRDRSLFTGVVVHEPRDDGRRLHSRVWQPDVSAQLVRLVQRDAEHRSGHRRRGEHDALYGGLPGQHQSTHWPQWVDLVRPVVRHAVDQRRFDAAQRHRNRTDDEHLESRLVGHDHDREPGIPAVEIVRLPRARADRPDYRSPAPARRPRAPARRAPRGSGRRDAR